MSRPPWMTYEEVLALGDGDIQRGMQKFIKSWQWRTPEEYDALAAERDMLVAVKIALVARVEQLEAMLAAMHEANRSLAGRFVTVAERDALVALVQKGLTVVLDFMPNLAHCALQDYKRLNEFMIEADDAGRLKDPCRIYEYDGAFRCYAHDKRWGAINDPDPPCAGWEPP